MSNLEILKAQLIYAGLTELPPDEMLEYEIASAEEYINYRRNYIPVDDEAPTVAPEFSRFVIPMCVGKILKTGADGQTSHSENGVSRSYKTDGSYPLDIIMGIPWAVR